MKLMEQDNMKSLILGGARSGKTSFALKQCEAMKEGLKLGCIYIATGTAGDEEMEQRIQRHRQERGAHWQTMEEPLDLPRLLVQQSRADCVVLVDCLTLWLSNVLLAELDCEAMTDALVSAVPVCAGPVVFVSNEVGLGIVPDNALARRFRDLQGRLNQKMAAACDHAVFMAAGLPIALKG